MRAAPVTVIGAGLAGSEAAWQLAVRGIPVELVEMRPSGAALAHHTAEYAELVCSNSFKSDDPLTAPGMLKREMASLGSLILGVARAHAVPAGAALAVDRAAFSASVTAALRAEPLITHLNEECSLIPDSGDVVLATGPLTSAPMQAALSEIVGEERLSFFDAAAPIVDAAGIDRTCAFAASRYAKGHGADYLNCPLTREEYDAFVEALASAERVVPRDFEPGDLFQACQPLEEIARAGHDALRYGAFKPVGLTDPRTGQRPWAVLQLRPENRSRTAYNLVGCQTNLTFPEQRRVFSLVPALRKADYVRYGVMHRNTFIDAPRLLDARMTLRVDPRLRIAGQLSGTEGYLEAAATGLVAGLAISAERSGRAMGELPKTTALGALIAYATDPATDPYQPMHVNFGILPVLEPHIRSKLRRREALARRGDAAIGGYVSEHEELLEPGRNALRRQGLDGRASP